MLKWIKRIVLGAVGLMFAALLVGVGYEQWGRFSAAQAHAPSGSLYEVAGRQSHLQCSGEGSPTIILEAGLDSGGSQSWANIFPDLASISRVCAYDRAGIMWSEVSDEPRDAVRMANELHALLAVASESPPYVMVGHSLGGVLIRVFDQRFSGEVAGFVLVDSSHPEQMERFPPELNSLMPSPLLLSVLSTTGVMRFTSGSEGPSVLPKDASEAYVALFPASMRGVIGEMEGLDIILSQAQQTGSLGDRPLIVLSAGKIPSGLPPEFTPSVIERMIQVGRELHKELAALSSNSDLRILKEAEHYVHWDDPAAVVLAVNDVIDAIRSNGRVKNENKENKVDVKVQPRMQQE